VKRNISTHISTPRLSKCFLLSLIMAYDDSVHWHGRAKEMLARAEQMNECVTRHVLCRIADVYEGLARKAEKQVKPFPPNPVSRTPPLTQARRSSPQKDRLVAHVKQMDEFATELVLRRVADACECLARTAGKRASPSQPKPVNKASLVPVEPPQLAHRRDRLGAPIPRVLSAQFPRFLEGPKAEKK
jgi:hypothetical protein